MVKVCTNICIVSRSFEKTPNKGAKPETTLALVSLVKVQLIQINKH